MKCDPARPLRADVVYLAPSGRRCRWMAGTGNQNQLTSDASFVYVDAPHGGRRRHREATLWHDGFCLSPANYQLLREVPDAATR